MATIRLIPSTYALSNSSYLSVSNVTNMYANIDSTTVGTVTHNRASTNNTYYLYLRGFNIDDVPSNAAVSDFTVKIKARATGHTTSTSSSYYMSLINGTTQIGSTSASGRLSTTTTTFTFANGSLDWATIVNYGSNFGIRVPLRRASSNTADVVSIYGAEIEVTYTVPNPRTVTSSLNGNGTINPSGTTNTYEGAEYTLTITPTNNSEEVTVTKNGTDVTSLLVPGYNSGTSAETNLGTYTLVSGSFNSGESYFQGLVGKGVNNTKTTSSYYSGGSGVIAVFTYALTFSNIPSNAIITRLYVRINGHAESTSNSSEYMCAQIMTGSTALSDELNFKDYGTSNSTQTIEATTLPTVAQLSNLKLQCRLGYYGGAINGATAYIEYVLPGVAPDYYTYTYTIGSTNDTIVVTIGASEALYIKPLGNWIKATKIYKKVNGNWTEVQLDTLTDRKLYFYKGGVGYNNSNIAMNFDGIDSYTNRFQDDTSGFEGDWVYPNGISNNFMRLFDVTADGQSFTFNGTTSYVRPNASGVFDGFLYSSHTIEAYFELSSFSLTDGNAFLLYVGRNSKANIAIYCYYYLNEFSFIKSSATNSTMLVMSSLSLNTKHYIAANANGWMFDGIYYPDSESSAGTSSVATNDMLNVSNTYACASIGMRFKTDRDPSPFNGKLYAMRIHNSKLTKNQLLQNMMCDIGRFGS